MNAKFALAVPVLLAATFAVAQQSSEPTLKIDSSNRTLTVSAEGQVSVEPDVAILHIGFETPPSDAKSAYAAGAKTSNAIIDAIKQAGIPATAIRSEWQQLQSVNAKQHKFTLAQQWTVKTPPQRAAEILDIAVDAGATDSGQIEWTVENMQALENQALEKATSRVKAEAAALAGGMGVHLGALLYVTKQFANPVDGRMRFAAVMNDRLTPSAPPLAIAPDKVSSSASVYAVYAIE